jgi:hypothetical protein
MGEENSQPTVEESTEPPIRAQRSTENHGPPTIEGQHTQLSEEGPPKSLTTAHTLTAEQVAQKLGVDVRYCAYLHLRCGHVTDMITAMDSALRKPNLAFSSMDLTRLKELKGYPSGRFS